jgi:predicted deacylase
MDEGVETSGAVENAFNAIKVPAITLEVGGPRRYQNEYISRAVEGITNVMIDKKMLKGKLGRTAADFGTAIAANFTSVEAQGGGYAEVLVAIGETLRKGQIIAYQRNAFGDVTREYTAPVAGLVAAIGTGATREAGGLLVRILW